MSTLAYAAFTNNREAAKPKTSSTSSPPGVKTYVDALAALVPSEVLTLHALCLSVTTKVDKQVTTITDAPLLGSAFAGLLLVSVALYCMPRWGRLNRLDVFRAAIPPLALLGWTMLQRSTAFDAICPDMNQGARTIAGLFLAVILGMAAKFLADKADEKSD